MPMLYFFLLGVAVLSALLAGKILALAARWKGCGFDQRHIPFSRGPLFWVDVGLTATIVVVLLAAMVTGWLAFPEWGALAAIVPIAAVGLAALGNADRWGAARAMDE